MDNPRPWLFDWNARGALATRDLPRALALAGAYPDPDAWNVFLRRLAIAAGATLLSAGVIFFIAFNWHDLPRMAKFALVEATIVVAIVACLVRGPDTLPGAVALCAAALFTGGLLALVGQVYQIGADTFELFAFWALAMLPWAVAGRQAMLWLVWLALVNLATQQWFALWGIGGFSRGDAALWTLFLLNAAALAAWEAARAAGLREFRVSWALRVVALSSGIAATGIGIVAVIGTQRAHLVEALAWLAWLGAIRYAFRVRRIDVFVLAGAWLSLIVVVTALLGKYLYGSGSPLPSLLIVAVVVGLASSGAVSLKRLVGKETA